MPLRERLARPTLGLVFTCEEGSRFTVWLNVEQPDQLLAVPAAHCALRFLTTGSAVRPYQGSALQDVRLVPGVLHYAGDLDALFWVVQGDSRTWHFRLERPVNRFPGSTSRILAERPTFASFPRIDVTGLPMEPQ